MFHPSAGDVMQSELYCEHMGSMAVGQIKPRHFRNDVELLLTAIYGDKFGGNRSLHLSSAVRCSDVCVCVLASVLELGKGTDMWGATPTHSICRTC